MRIYPDQNGRRIDLMARDLAVALALVLFGLIALEVHDAVDQLAVLGEVSSLPGTALAAASSWRPTPSTARR